MDAATAKFGFDVLMGLGARELQKAQVRAQNTINQANVYASNLMRGANNELAAKRGSLARYTQSVNNQRQMKNTGDQMEAAAVNYQRTRDELRRADFEQQIQFAEQAGAQAAASAASGLVGGVADAVAGTVALRKARIQQATTTRDKAMAFDAGRVQANILRAGLSSLDNDTVVDDIDFSIDVFTAMAKPSYIGALAPAVGNYMNNRSGQSSKQSFNFGTAFKYNTRPGSQQTRMLAEQDSWF